jgi:hypothetical protein
MAANTNLLETARKNFSLALRSPLWLVVEICASLTAKSKEALPQAPRLLNRQFWLVVQLMKLRQGLNKKLSEANMYNRHLQREVGILFSRPRLVKESASNGLLDLTFSLFTTAELNPSPQTLCHSQPEFCFFRVLATSDLQTRAKLRVETKTLRSKEAAEF